MPALQYDPTRLAPLRAAAATAFQHLLAARSADPAAASALRVAALARSHLEHGWLPAVDRLVASDAMLSWSSTAPIWARGLTGRALGEALAAEATEQLSFGSSHGRAELAAVLRAAAGDDAAMATFFAMLGPAALLDLIVTAASGDTMTLELPMRVRDAFERAAAAGDLAAGYGRDLVRAAVAENERAGGMGDGGLAVAFLFHGGDLPGPIVLEAVEETIVQEELFATRMGGDREIGVELWRGTGTNAARGLWLDFDEPHRSVDLDAVDAQDPMYALLGQLARAGNGAQGRELFTDTDRTRYLFAGREVLADGGVAIVTAAANAAAGPDVVTGPPSRVLDDASLVASAFVNLFGLSNAGRARADDRTATGAARILSAHMYGVQHAFGADNAVTDDERRRELGSGAEPQTTPDVPSAAIAELANGAFASPRTAAVFDPPALTSVVRLAARTDAGIAALRGGLSQYDQTIAAATAARLADGGIAPSRAPAHLAEVMTDAARLEGAVMAHVGEEVREGDRDRDTILSFWIRGVGKAAGAGTSLLGPGSSAVLGAGVDATEDALVEVLAGGERQAVIAHQARVGVAGERLTYLWVRELHAADLVDAPLPPGIVVDGELPTYEDLVVTLVDHGPPGWEVSTVIQQLDESPDGIVDIDVGAVLDAMQAAEERAIDGPG